MLRESQSPDHTPQGSPGGALRVPPPPAPGELDTARRIGNPACESAMGLSPSSQSNPEFLILVLIILMQQVLPRRVRQWVLPDGLVLRELQLHLCRL